MIAKHPTSRERFLACDVYGCHATFRAELDPAPRARARAAKAGWTVGRYEAKARDLCPAHAKILDVPAPEEGDHWAQKKGDAYGLVVLRVEGATVTYCSTRASDPDWRGAPGRVSVSYIQQRFRLAQRPEGTPVQPPRFGAGR